MRIQLNSFFRIVPVAVALLFTLTAISTPSYSQNDNREKDFSFIEGLRLLNLGNIDAAEKIFHGLSAKNPEMDAAHYYLSNIYIKKGDLKRAEKSTAEAVRLDPDNYWYKIQLARIYSATNQLDKATEVYEDIRSSNPSRSDLYIDMIDLYTRRQDYPKALAILDDIERVSGKNEATGLTRYNIMIGQQRQQEAIDFLREFAKEQPSPRIATVLGDYYAGIQKDTLAMDYYTSALSMDPKYIPATFGIAEGYRIRGQFDLYFGYMFPFMANSEVNPRLKSDYMKEILANPKFVQTFYPQIDTMMQNLYGAHPQDSIVAYGFAVFMVQTARPDIGLKVLEKNIENYPLEREPMHQLLSLIYYLEQWENLISKSDSALGKFPGDLDFIQLKGIGELQLNRTESAIKTFQSILPLAKGDSATTVRTLSILGDTYYMAGNKKEAYKYYQKTIRLEPNHAAALNNYAYYLSEEGKQLKKAMQMSKRTIEIEPENATYLDTYAWILHKLGQNVEAKAILKQAMVYGGNENADILDHYAEVLFALGERDLAFMYWGQADKLDPSLGIAEKVENLKKK